MRLALLALTILSFQTLANWQLQSEQSTLNFISTKNSHVMEVHRFDQLEGSVDGTKLKVSVPLSSVNTMIPIRNERLQSMLFNAVEFPLATFDAKIEEQWLNLESGESISADITGMLSLSGESKEVSFSIVITRLAHNELRVTTATPTIIQAKEFGLLPGVEALRNVAGLKVISHAIPVTFDVVFNRG